MKRPRVLLVDDDDLVLRSLSKPLVVEGRFDVLPFGLSTTLLVLVVGGMREEEVLTLTGYASRTYSEHLAPVMRAVERATGSPVKNARDCAFAVTSSVLRNRELPRVLGVRRSRAHHREGSCASKGVVLHL